MRSGSIHWESYKHYQSCWFGTKQIPLFKCLIKCELHIGRLWSSLFLSPLPLYSSLESGSCGTTSTPTGETSTSRHLPCPFSFSSKPPWRIGVPLTDLSSSIAGNYFIFFLQFITLTGGACLLFHTLANADVARQFAPTKIPWTFKFLTASELLTRRCFHLEFGVKKRNETCTITASVNLLLPGISPPKLHKYCNPTSEDVNNSENAHPPLSRQTALDVLIHLFPLPAPSLLF